MEPALAAIWISVALGAALGIWQRFAPRATDPIRTFAVVAAVLVVGLSLLPHALACEGIAGLVGAGLGYAAIPALEQLGSWLFRHGDARALRLELGYSGLLLHRFGDGIAMSVDGHGYGVLWALGAHEVPIVALVTMAFARRGLSSALSRAALLGLSSSLGYWLVRATPAATWHELHGWADAIAAGVLIHIVAHEAFEERLGLDGAAAHIAAAAAPRAPRASLARRALDVSAALSALVLVAISGLEHDAEAPGLLEQLLQLALAVAPLWCLGLFARAFVRSLGRSPHSALLERVRRVALDAPVLALSGALLGWPFALLQCGAVLALALGDAPERAASSSGLPGVELEAARLNGRRFWQELERGAAELGGWMSLGLLAAAYALAFVPPLPQAGLSLGEQAGWVSVLAALAYASPAAAVPLAAVAVSQGLGAGTALVGLVLGAAAQRSRLHSGAAFTARGAGVLALLAAASIASGWLLNRTPGLALVSLEQGGVEPKSVHWFLLACLALVVARRIWRTGVRGWLHDSLLASGLRREPTPHVHTWVGLRPSEDGP